MIIKNILKMPEKEQKQKLFAFARLSIDTRITILSNQRDIFHRLKKKYPNIMNSILSYASLIFSIEKYFSETNKVKINVDNMKNIKRFETSRKDKLLSKWSLIKELKCSEKLSFRNIEIYLSKHHNLEISYVTIFRVWKDIEGNYNAD